MAEAITIVCPECDKKMNVAADAVGKKIRCKGCQHVFAITAPAVKKAAKPAAKAAPAKKAPAAKPKADDDDDELNSNPYGITSVDTAPRCPDCANEMESEDAVVCLHCGYNTTTRQKIVARAVEDVTGMTWTLWLLPGILCAITTLVLLTFDVWYTFQIHRFVGDDDWTAVFASQAFIIWLVWAPTVILMVGTTTFAFRRLVLNPRPPERVKMKKSK